VFSSSDSTLVYLTSMSQSSEKTFASDSEGSCRGQKGKEHKEQSAGLNKTTNSNHRIIFIEERCKELPIYHFRETLVQAVRDVCEMVFDRVLLVDETVRTNS
jgi:hypothetical protein